MELYESDFQTFLKYTNEKKILRDEIIKIIKKLKIKSILDVGAGNGDLSYPLSKEVEDYLCVEPKKGFADLLRAKGLKVIEDKFPVRIDKRFDLVLCSHSIPYDKPELISFLNSAWENVKNRGSLLIITYIGKGDDWNKFLDSIGQKSSGDAYISYEDKLKMLNSFGKLKIKEVFSEVNTKRVEDMIRALSFIAGGGIQNEKDFFLQRQEVIKKILKKKYFRKGVYFFPFRHIFILIRK